MPKFALNLKANSLIFEDSQSKFFEALYFENFYWFYFWFQLPIFAHLKAECLPKLAPTNIALKIPFFWNLLMDCKSSQAQIFVSTWVTSWVPRQFQMTIRHNNTSIDARLELPQSLLNYWWMWLLMECAKWCRSKF